jgi:hypothetical protein
MGHDIADPGGGCDKISSKIPKPLGNAPVLVAFPFHFEVQVRAFPQKT